MATRQVISHEDLDAGRVDFSNAESAGRLPPVHPGDVLRHDFLEPLGLSAHALAMALRVPPNRITTIRASGSTCKKPTNWRSRNAPGASASGPRSLRVSRPDRSRPLNLISGSKSLGGWY
jgi:addiction module HigA family antidote